MNEIKMTKALALAKKLQVPLDREPDATITGAALATAVSLWVLQHRMKGDIDPVDYQRVTLEGFIGLVMKLMPHYAQAIKDQEATRQ